MKAGRARALARLARQRGFSHVSTTLEAAAIMGWFAVAIVSEKHLDDAVTSRRASETSAEESAHGSAAAGAAKPIEESVGEARPRASVVMESADKLGVDDGAMPSLGALGVSPSAAFSSQRSPMKRAVATSRTNGSFHAERAIVAQEPAPSATAPQIAPLRSTLWNQHLKGY